MNPKTLLLCLFASFVSAYEIPPSLQTLYGNLTSSGSRSCKSFVRGRHNLNDGHGHSGFGFCTQVPGAMFLRGPRKTLGDMDIDCDGGSNCGGQSNDYQPATAFDGQLKGGGYNITTLSAEVHPFVVLGTCDVDVTPVVKPLSVVAVICNGELHYAVFGDTNGCDDNNFTGEASLALGRLCFPQDGLSGDQGHEEHDVLYLAFTSADAVPGPQGAAWTTQDPKEFEASLKGIGDAMIKGLGDNWNLSGASGRAGGSRGTGVGMLLLSVVLLVWW